MTTETFEGTCPVCKKWAELVPHKTFSDPSWTTLICRSCNDFAAKAAEFKRLYAAFIEDSLRSRRPSSPPLPKPKKEFPPIDLFSRVNTEADITVFREKLKAFKLSPIMAEIVEYVLQKGTVRPSEAVGLFGTSSTAYLSRLRELGILGSDRLESEGRGSRPVIYYAVIPKKINDVFDSDGSGVPRLHPDVKEN